jgi:hypothetical protein
MKADLEQHSGTALDLPYVYSTEGKIKEPKSVFPIVICTS